MIGRRRSRGRHSGTHRRGSAPGARDRRIDPRHRLVVDVRDPSAARAGATSCGSIPAAPRRPACSTPSRSRRRSWARRTDARSDPPGSRAATARPQEGESGASRLASATRRSAGGAASTSRSAERVAARARRRAVPPPGSLASARARTVSSSLGSSGRAFEGGVGSSCTCAQRSATSVARGKGDCPVRHS